MHPQITIDPAQGDETLIQLDEDQIAVAKKQLSELWMLLKVASEAIEENSLTVSKRSTYCGCLEAFAGHLTQALGYESDLRKQGKDRARYVREANEEIRRLESLVGSARGAEGIPNAIKLMRDNFHKFWKDQGFLLVYDSPGHGTPRMSGRGIGGGFFPARGQLFYRAECSLDPNQHVFSDSLTPVTDKQKVREGLDDLSQVLDLYTRENDCVYLLDTSKNRNHIETLLKRKYPSLRIDSWGVESSYTEEMLLRWVGITIENCEELLLEEN